MLSKKIFQVTDVIKSKKIKIISFDIFDTLLAREAGESLHVFNMVEAHTGFAGFANQRKCSEVVSRKASSGHTDDTTFDEIYKRLSQEFGYSNEDIELLKATELNIERSMLRPRDSIKRIYDEAVRLSKTIIAVSDMYLPSEFLQDVLNLN